jgi:CMP-2-keto-3-deoxyoctulosonic acid synthetase
MLTVHEFFTVAKPLAMICGEPLVVHTLRRAQAASRVSRVIVATDNEEIVRVVREAGGEAVMTSYDCNTGTQRVSEASLILPPEFSVVINVQGDEPLVDPAHIDLLAHYLVSTHDRQRLPSELWRASETVTLAAPIQSLEQFLSPHVVKVVTAAPAPTSNEGPEWGGVRRALYFSRAPVPHLKPRFFETRSARPLEERGGMGRQARGSVGAGEELRGAAMLAALQVAHGPLQEHVFHMLLNRHSLKYALTCRGAEDKCVCMLCVCIYIYYGLLPL